LTKINFVLIYIFEKFSYLLIFEKIFLLTKKEICINYIKSEKNLLFEKRIGVIVFWVSIYS